MAQPGVRVRVRFGAAAQRARRTAEARLSRLLSRRGRADKGPAALAQVVSPEPSSRELSAAAPSPTVRGQSRRCAPARGPPRRPGRSAVRGAPAASAPTRSWEVRTGPGVPAVAGLGRRSRAVWTALPGPQWAEEIARAVQATLASGRGALVSYRPGGPPLGWTRRSGADGRRPACAADRRRRAGAAVPGMARRAPRCGARRRRDAGGHVRPGARSRAGRRVGRRGRSHRTTTPSSACPRGAGASRSRDSCAFLLGSWSCTVEAAQLVESGWAAPLVADREQVRALAPLVRTVGDGTSHGTRRQGGASAHARLAGRTGRPAPGAGAGTGSPARLCAPHGLRPVAGRPPAAGTGRTAVAQDAGELRCAWCGAAGDRLALSGVRWIPAAGPDSGGSADRRGAGAGVSGRRCADLGTRAGAGHGAGHSRAGVSTPGAEAGRRGRIRGGTAPRRVGHARPSRSEGRRGGVAALDRRECAGTAAVGRRTVVVVAEPTLRPVQALVRWAPSGTRSGSSPSGPSWFPAGVTYGGRIGSADAVTGFLGGARLPSDRRGLGPVPLPVTEAGRTRRPGGPPPGERWERASSGCRREAGPRWPPRSRRRWPPARARRGRGRWRRDVRIRSTRQTSGDGPAAESLAAEGGGPGAVFLEPRTRRNVPAAGHGARTPVCGRRALRQPPGGSGERKESRAQPLRGREGRGPHLVAEGGGARRRLGRHRTGSGDRGHGTGHVERAADGRVGCSFGFGGRLGGGAAGAVTAVHRLLGDAQCASPRASHEKPSERSKSTAAVTRVSTLSRNSWASGRSERGRVRRRRSPWRGRRRGRVDVAQLSGEGAQCVHLPADPLDVPHQQVQAGPGLGVVGCVVGHEQASSNRR